MSDELIRALRATEKPDSMQGIIDHALVRNIDTPEARWQRKVEFMKRKNAYEEAMGLPKTDYKYRGPGGDQTPPRGPEGGGGY